MELDPRVALGNLPVVGPRVQVAAHVAARDMAETKSRQHEVREVLTHTGTEREEIIGRRIVASDVLPIDELLPDVAAKREHLASETRAGVDARRVREYAQGCAVTDGSAEFEEIEQLVGGLPERRRVLGCGKSAGRGLGRDERAGADLDAVVEVHDREVVDYVAVPVAVTRDLRRRANSQHEGRERLVRRRLRLHPELEKRLADERVIAEGQRVLDLEEHD